MKIIKYLIFNIMFILIIPTSFGHQGTLTKFRRYSEKFDLLSGIEEFYFLIILFITIVFFSFRINFHARSWIHFILKFPALLVSVVFIFVSYLILIYLFFFAIFESGISNIPANIILYSILLTVCITAFITVFSKLRNKSVLVFSSFTMLFISNLYLIFIPIWLYIPAPPP